MDEGRRERGAFLRDRRGQVDRAAFGLPPGARGARTGLRREEVATFAGVSVTWYTWLEQGRSINPSRQVLDAIARVLRLDTAEHAYLLALGSTPDAPRAAPPTAPPHLQRLLDALDFPAFAVAPDWTIAAWNAAYVELYPRIAEVRSADRNLLWLVFTDRELRSLLPDWESQSRHFLGEFRAEVGARIGSDAHTALVARLRAASTEFDALWSSRTIERFSSRMRVFEHPVRGRLVYEQHRLDPADAPDLHVVLYAPAPGSPPS
jgi:transcriptional regulator with XRE-family HTH domain